MVRYLPFDKSGKYVCLDIAWVMFRFELDVPIVFPVRICDLSLNSQLVFTVYKAPVPANFDVLRDFAPSRSTVPVDDLSASSAMQHDDGTPGDSSSYDNSIQSKYTTYQLSHDPESMVLIGGSTLNMFDDTGYVYHCIYIISSVLRTGTFELCIHKARVPDHTWPDSTTPALLVPTGEYARLKKVQGRIDKQEIGSSIWLDSIAKTYIDKMGKVCDDNVTSIVW